MNIEKIAQSITLFGVNEYTSLQIQSIIKDNPDAYDKVKHVENLLKHAIHTYAGMDEKRKDALCKALAHHIFKFITT